MAAIAVLGDFNDTPDSDPLAPLLGQGSELKDVSAHPAFQGDGRPGTFGNGTKSEKFDYILLSPELFAKVTQAGVFRKGVWGGKNGTLFEHYVSHPELLAARPHDGAGLAGGTDEDDLARRVTDYIAGMTDRFALSYVETL